jgi:hypothetical protein
MTPGDRNILTPRCCGQNLRNFQQCYPTACRHCICPYHIFLILPYPILYISKNDRISLEGKQHVVFIKEVVRRVACVKSRSRYSTWDLSGMRFALCTGGHHPKKGTSLHLSDFTHTVNSICDTIV